MDQVLTASQHDPLVKFSAHLYISKETGLPQLAWHSSSSLKVDSVVAFQTQK